MLFLALIGGMLGGFIIFEWIVRIVMRLMDSFPVALIGTLSMILPLAGGIVTVLLVKRMQNKVRED
ncbi:hypothetical protein PAECIP111802_07141 [Paenibacillus allorhizosphaerae]|uniref:ATPase n=2 Tax=Paenibacillus allorhizosphaerae TaxID=2849866 RepID=A0ABN7TWQ6_9BACL|nr:hypothetical protein PAECIP111802_07141 [Paenibacillus allorhizosphaerae]